MLKAGEKIQIGNERENVKGKAAGLCEGGTPCHELAAADTASNRYSFLLHVKNHRREHRTRCGVVMSGNRLQFTHFTCPCKWIMRTKSNVTRRIKLNVGSLKIHDYN